MGAPMSPRRAVGVIAIQSYDEEGVFDTEHLSVLENLASQAAAAVETRGYQVSWSQDSSGRRCEASRGNSVCLQSENWPQWDQLISGVAHELNNPSPAPSLDSVPAGTCRLRSTCATPVYVACNSPGSDVFDFLIEPRVFHRRRGLAGQVL